jgi:hypothetical protein
MTDYSWQYIQDPELAYAIMVAGLQLTLGLFVLVCVIVLGASLYVWLVSKRTKRSK